MSEDYENKVFQYNKVTIVGKINSVRFSHSVYEESYYTAIVDVPRHSNTLDQLPILIPSKVYNVNSIKESDTYSITGELRSYNRYEDNKSKLVITLFAQSIENVDKDHVSTNEVVLDGFICKPTTLRTTPLCKEISDIILAVNRSHHRSSYIPCVTWGYSARYAKTLKVGSRIEIKGRFQSRQYEKLIGVNMETKTAYEVSISQLSLISNCEEKIIS